MGGGHWNVMWKPVLRLITGSSSWWFSLRGERGARGPFTTSSGWEPKRSQVTELVWKIVEEDERVVKGVREVELV